MFKLPTNFEQFDVSSCFEHMQFEHVRVNMGVNIYNTVVNILNTRTIKLNTYGHVTRLISLVCSMVCLSVCVEHIGELCRNG